MDVDNQNGMDSDCSKMPKIVLWFSSFVLQKCDAMKLGKIK